MSTQPNASFLLGLVAALALTSQGLVASAQSGAGAESMESATTQEGDMDDERARGAFRLGRQYYEQGQFAQAATEFERAYGLSGRGQLLFNAYLAYRDAGDQANALRTLRGYLAAVPEAEDREHLEARAEALAASVSEAEMREAETRAREEAARQAQQEAEEARRRAASGPGVRHVDGEAWPWAILGVGGAMLITGAITGGLAISERGSLDTNCPIMLCPVDFDLQGAQDNISTLALVTDVMLIGGAVLAGTGLILAIVLGPRDEPLEDAEPTAPPPEASAGCTTDGCSASLRMRF